MSNKELKPCPFCGGKVVVMGSNDDSRFYMVVCLKCNLKAKWYHDFKDEAITHWNTRNYMENQDSSNSSEIPNSSSKVIPLVSKWREDEVSAWIKIEISQFGVLFFNYGKESKQLIFSVQDKVEYIHHYEELGKFNTLEEAKAKVNEYIKELGESLVYFSDNIKTDE